MDGHELIELANREADKGHERYSSTWIAYMNGFIEGFRKAEQEQHIKDIMKMDEEESYKIEHLINDTYQVIGETTGTIWKQGTLEECSDWMML
jgi:hypothetical protein